MASDPELRRALERNPRVAELLRKELPVERRELPCVYLGADTGELTECVDGCLGVRLKMFVCDVFGACTLAKRGRSAPGCCKGCEKYEGKRTMEWASAVTTVPSRLTTYLPRTLVSIGAAGFPKPWLYVDGCTPEQGCAYAAIGAAGITLRSEPARVHGNWILALYETYIRYPLADRYAVFQDDVILCRNVRQYIDSAPWPEKSYLNLYTPQIERYYATCSGKEPRGWAPSTQRGKGALALCFDKDAVVALLTSKHMVDRPVPTSKPDIEKAKEGEWYRGQHAVDGGIVESLSAKAGIREMQHIPSLAQHLGEVSSFSRIQHLPAVDFPGEEFDCVSQDRLFR